MSRPRRQTISEYSAGGAVCRRSERGWEVLAVRRARHTDWSLPKGHIEEGESREEAAVREVREETGIEARIVRPVGEINYFYRRKDGALVQKSVFYFLMEPLTHETGPPNWEVAEARWVPIDEARNLLTYANDKGIVSQAVGMLEVPERR